jgi:hypothetical protein
MLTTRPQLSGKKELFQFRPRDLKKTITRPRANTNPACKGRKRLSRHPCTSITQKTRPQSDPPTPQTRGEKFPATRQTTRHPPHADLPPKPPRPRSNQSPSEGRADRDVPGSGGLARFLGVSDGPPEPEARNFSRGPSPTGPARIWPE